MPMPSDLRGDDLTRELQQIIASWGMPNTTFRVYANGKVKILHPDGNITCPAWMAAQVMNELAMTLL